MTTHTPGPWNVVDTNDNRRRLQIHSSLGPVIVALIPNVDERDMTGITKEANANARLIAAAPRMLDALREIDEWYDLIKQNYPEMVRPFTRARALLREIEGG